jgi:SAM-dependent methyltransferase
MSKEWFKEYFDDIYLEVNKDSVSFKRTEAEVDFIIESLKLDNTKRVLDLGCGWGRHSILVSKKVGCKIYALDLSQTLLDYAKKEAEKDKQEIVWICGDMRDREKYPLDLDSIYCMFGTFGYFDDGENIKVLENISYSLKPNGLFLLELNNFYKLIKFLSPKDVSSLTLSNGEVVYVIDERELLMFENKVRVNRKFFYLNSKKIVERNLVIRNYTLPEIKSLFEKVDMKIVEIFGDLKFNKPSIDSNKFYILAQK